MIFKDAHAKRQKEIRDLMKKRREKAVLVDRISRLESQINTHLKLYLDTKDNIYIDMQAGIFRGLEKMCKQHNLCRTHGILSSGLLLIYHFVYA